MKAELMEKLHALKVKNRETQEKVNAIKQDRLLSEEGKAAALAPLAGSTKEAIKETRNKLAYMRGSAIGDVGAAIASRRDRPDTGNYAKSAYHFQRLQALPQDMRGFNRAWETFKSAADMGDVDILRASIDAMETRWPEYAEQSGPIIEKVKNALLPEGDTAVINAKARTKALLEMVSFAEAAAEHASLHPDDPKIIDDILSRALVKLSEFQFEEPQEKELEPLHRALLKIDVPPSSSGWLKRNSPDDFKDPKEVAEERAAVDEGIRATS
ncbi:hypothetical protein SDC9_79520 [bioreactor metagenome]|uniref:Uncharacterized protein n=1 Tax=bioreactor metagenome TaxID=1076179 RepID=A0A644Z2J2_9ZZZZ|nr:hypothetical protein [Aminivibrio sp.]MEA4951958.1 hypothetical protein [Aminivibrio sp.]